MNKEICGRLKTAIYALFPERVGRHLDVIEKELKMMALETASDIVKECRKYDNCTHDYNKEPEVKKVDIE